MQLNHRSVLTEMNGKRAGQLVANLPGRKIAGHRDSTEIVRCANIGGKNISEGGIKKYRKTNFIEICCEKYMPESFMLVRRRLARRMMESRESVMRNAKKWRVLHFSAIIPVVPSLFFLYTLDRDNAFITGAYLLKMHREA